VLGVVKLQHYGNHVYIEMPSKESWEHQHERFKPLLDDEAYYCQVPNSLGGPPHPQFTIKLSVYGKITVWCQYDG